MTTFHQPQILKGTGCELVPPNEMHHLAGLLQHVAATEKPDGQGFLKGLVHDPATGESVTVLAARYWKGSRVRVTGEHAAFDAHLPGWLPTDSPDDIPPFAALLRPHDSYRQRHDTVSPACQRHLAEFVQVGTIVPAQFGEVCGLMNKFDRIDPTGCSWWREYQGEGATLFTFPLRQASDHGRRARGVLALLDFGDFAFLLESPWWEGFWPPHVRPAGRPAHLHSSRVTEGSFWINPRKLMERTLAEQEQAEGVQP